MSRTILACVVVLAVSACAPEVASSQLATGEIPDLGNAISSAGLAPDQRLEVTIEPAAGRVTNGLLLPYQEVAVSSVAGSPLVASQVMIFLRLDGAVWKLVGCTADAELDSAPSGCDLEGAAQVIIPPGASISDRDPLPFVLDWPRAVEPVRGTYAVVVAFGEGRTYDRGAAGLLRID